MRFYLDKEDGNCLRDSEDHRVLCRTKREFQSLKNQILKFEQLNDAVYTTDETEAQE